MATITWDAPHPMFWMPSFRPCQAAGCAHSMMATPLSMEASWRS